MHCNDGRTEPAERVGVIGVVTPPETELKKQFVGAWMWEKKGNGYKTIA